MKIMCEYVIRSKRLCALFTCVFDVVQKFLFTFERGTFFHGVLMHHREWKVHGKAKKRTKRKNHKMNLHFYDYCCFSPTGHYFSFVIVFVVIEESTISFLPWFALISSSAIFLSSISKKCSFFLLLNLFRN